MPPPAARAPPDGGFLLPARDAESRSPREEQVEREQNAGRADVNSPESGHSAINKQTKQRARQTAGDAEETRREAARIVWTERAALLGAGNCLYRR